MLNTSKRFSGIPLYKQHSELDSPHSQSMDAMTTGPSNKKVSLQSSLFKRHAFNTIDESVQEDEDVAKTN